MRWILLVVAIVALAVAFRTTSAAVLAVTLLIAAVAALASFFGFLRSRVDEVASAQGSREIELLMAMRAKHGPPGPKREAVRDGAAGQAAWLAGEHGDDADHGGDAGGHGGDGGGGGD